jgi:hypothetical protein
LGAMAEATGCEGPGAKERKGQLRLPRATLSYKTPAAARPPRTHVQYSAVTAARAAIGCARDWAVAEENIPARCLR